MRRSTRKRRSTSTSASAASRKRSTWSATVFGTRYDDFIYLADTGVIDAGAELPIFVYAQADARFSGIEAELLVPLLNDGSNQVDLRLFADYVRGELTNGEPLPRLPPLRFGWPLRISQRETAGGHRGDAPTTSKTRSRRSKRRRPVICCSTPIFVGALLLWRGRSSSCS